MKTLLPFPVLVLLWFFARYLQKKYGLDPPYWYFYTGFFLEIAVGVVGILYLIFLVFRKKKKTPYKN